MTLALLLASSLAFAAEHTTDSLLKSSDQQTNSKPHKRISRPQMNGVFSVDLIAKNGRVHLLTGTRQAGQKSLEYRYSDDGGQHWSNNNTVLNNDDLAIRAARGNDAQIAVQGETIVVTWAKFDPAVRFNAGPMQAARSVDGGTSWQTSATPPDWNEGSHGFADMASDNKFIHAVWLDSRPINKETKGRQGVRYARSSDGGLSWQKNLTVDGYSCSCCWNTIATDDKENAYILYRDKKPSDLSIGVINNQQQWQYLSHVGDFNWQFDGCPHIGGGLAFQTAPDHKRLHSVVGTGHPEYLGIYYLQSDDAGKSWSSAKPLGDESAIHSDIAAHDDGRVIAVWDMMGEAGLAVFFAESKDHGKRWSSAKQLSAPHRRASHPRIVKTNNGFLAAWTESDGKQQLLVTKGL